jgi:cytochrome c2
VAGRIAIALLVTLAACQEPTSAVSDLADTSSTSGEQAVSGVEAMPSGDRGHALVARFQCSRCHHVPTEPVQPMMKRCVGCHRAIAKGQFRAPKDVLREWQERMHSLPAAPSLGVAAYLYEPEWVVGYLLRPHDLRPHLEASMPRLKLSETQARDIATYLGELGGAVMETGKEEPRLPEPGLVDEGERLYEEKQCDRCHLFGGREPEGLDASSVAVALAPDLRWARERVRPARLVTWIQEPPKRISGVRMPHFPMTTEEARALASFVLYAPVGPLEAVTVPERLPLLDRPVGYAEVEERVFRKICWHCHAQPDLARGDGGPGMSGGFGFAPRHLDLSTYESINSGYLDADGELTSLFAKTDDGTPRLVAVLLARQHEVATQYDDSQPEQGALRGMPLGFPPMSPEDIQLVESWVAQGRPR